MSKRKPTVLARTLRRRQTYAEARLWGELRTLRALGVRFRRQHPIGHYIVDFVCLEKKLVLEVDGGQHNEEPGNQQDAERTAWLESEGYRVIRFWNNDVFSNMDGVGQRLAQFLEELSPSSSPSPLEGEGIRPLLCGSERNVESTRNGR